MEYLEHNDEKFKICGVLRQDQIPENVNPNRFKLNYYGSTFVIKHENNYLFLQHIENANIISIEENGKRKLLSDKRDEEELSDGGVKQ